MTPLEVFRFLLERVGRGEPAGLWTVVAHQGSSPGRAGFLMGVSPGAAAGTVGGGVMEGQLVDLARDRLGRHSQDVLLVERVHREQAPAEARSGLICSGAQRLAFCPLGQADRPTLERMTAGLEAGRAVGFSLSQDGIASRIEDTLREERPPSFRESGDGFLYEAWIGPRHTVYVFGSGHIGLAVCRALEPLDFHVIAFDDRPDLEQVRENRHASERVIGPYAKVRERVTGGCRAYGVVVTAQRDHDAEVLAQIADLPFRYLGVMGSRAKLSAIRRALTDAGVDGDSIARIRGPVGLEIGAETPAEIAASIVAELVQVRRERAPGASAASLSGTIRSGI